jgi:adenine-specific DNA-methyltransferase
MSGKRPRLKKVERETPGIVPEQVEKLKELFPEAVSEGKVDFDKLKATLGEFADERPERYSFTWNGKRDCIKLLQVPSRATLVPCPDESIDWNSTNSVFIEGENLEVLKLLYKAYYGRVKMIYIDPPYNTGKDFIYPDNYADPLDTYLRLTGQKDAVGNVLTSNPETSGRYHSAWLSMMYPRLFVARQLLRDDGVIFVSIDDNEEASLRLMMDEVFGEENFLAVIVVQSNKRGQTYRQISKTHEYLLAYTRSSDVLLGEFTKKEGESDLTFQDDLGKYVPRDLRNRNPKFGRFNRPNLFYPTYVNAQQVDKDGFSPVSLVRDKAYSLEVLPLNSEGGESCWRWGKQLMQANLCSETLKSQVVAKGKSGGGYWIYEKYRKETYKAKSIWTETNVISEQGTMELGALGLGGAFDFPKPIALLKKALQLSSGESDLILDFTAGSATTAQAVLEINREESTNRRFILVQLPEPVSKNSAAAKRAFKTIADIGKERTRRVIAKMKKEQEGKLATDAPQDMGFRVYKLAESNMKPWQGTDEKDPEKYAKTMEMFLDPLVEGWKPEDVIAEVALKEAGFGLNCRVEEVEPQMNADGRRLDSEPKPKTSVGVHRRASAVAPTVYRVTDEDKEQSFYICLDDKVRLEDVKFLNLTRDMLFICRDVALDDETAANLALQCRLRTI